MSSFGNYIKVNREKLGIPQRKIAAQLDIDTSTLSKIENGERKASSIMLKVFSNQLNLPLDEVEYWFLKDSVLADFSKLQFLKNNLSKLIKEL